MNNVLRDILINAKQESFRMHHYYVGVEHVFIGLLEIRGGFTSSLIEAQGFTSDYLIDAIRRQMGKGTRQRLWAGVRHTPRYEVVMSIANDLALDAGKRNDDFSEQELLMAILEEGDSVPLRVLKKLGINLEKLAHEAQTHDGEAQYKTPNAHIRISFSDAYPPEDAILNDQLIILRRMFHEYSQLHVERHLNSGYSSAVMLLVTPMNDHHQLLENQVVVKLDNPDVILDEVQYFEQNIKGILPPITAYIEDMPTSAKPSDYAGLKYSFSGEAHNRGMKTPAYEIFSKTAFGEWLQQALYTSFETQWWGLRKPYHFQVWMEYDWLLPPLLTLEFMGNDETVSARHVLRDPIRRNRISDLEYGDIIAVENFTVQRVDHEKDTIEITIGKGSEAAKRAYRIHVKGVNLAQTAYYRGETIDRLVGRVWKNREELLQNATGALFPDFDPRTDVIPGIPEADPLPNTLLAYPSLLELHIHGLTSRIHGDLHLGNIIADAQNKLPYLIDFAHAREGHTIFDWACLEVDVIDKLLMPALGDDWNAARLATRCIYALNHGTEVDIGESTEAYQVMRLLKAIREIGQTCLAKPNEWNEYHIALSLCCLRGVTWDKISLAGRRAMFLIAGLSLNELSAKPSGNTSGRSPNYFDDAGITNIKE